MSEEECLAVDHAEWFAGKPEVVLGVNESQALIQKVGEG